MTDSSKEKVAIAGESKDEVQAPAMAPTTSEYTEPQTTEPTEPSQPATASSAEHFAEPSEAEPAGMDPADEPEPLEPDVRTRAPSAEIPHS